MKLIDNWRTELNRLWSVWGLVGTAVLAIADQVLDALQLSPLTYAVCAIVVIILRLIAQTAPKDAVAPAQS